MAWKKGRPHHPSQLRRVRIIIYVWKGTTRSRGVFDEKRLLFSPLLEMERDPTPLIITQSFLTERTLCGWDDSWLFWRIPSIVYQQSSPWLWKMVSDPPGWWWWGPWISCNIGGIDMFHSKGKVLESCVFHLFHARVIVFPSPTNVIKQGEKVGIINHYARRTIAMKNVSG